MAFDLGVMFQGNPDISLSADGPIADPAHPFHAIFQEELEKEEKELQDDIDEFKYYPVITLGLTYKI